MKKYILILFAGLIVNIASAQNNTFVSASIDSVGNSVITYIDNLGQSKTTNIKGINASIVSLINDSLSAITDELAPVDYVVYVGGQFTITGKKVGEKMPFIPVVKDYSNLLKADRDIIDSLYTTILRVSGVSMSNFNTQFGSNKITVNGTLYNYEYFLIDANAVKAFRDAINLATLIYNRKK